MPPLGAMINSLSHNPTPRSDSYPPPVDPKALILLMGPRDDTREMLKVALELWNYQVVEAENSDDSIRLVKDRHPSVILMDTPLLFGETLNTLSKLHASDSIGRTPYIVLSGYPQESYRKEAWRRGAACFLVKPIDFDILRTYIDTLVEQTRNMEGSIEGNKLK